MKLKAAATRTLPPALLEALNSAFVVSRFYEVIIRHLHVSPDSIGPATHFVQETDLTIPRSNNAPGGINIAFTMVSVNRYRSAEDFLNALRAVVQIYRELVWANVFKGQRVQLFPAMALDVGIEGPDGKTTKLLELNPEWVEGQLETEAATE